MRIVFLGSSHGVPEPNRKCSCAMIEIGDARYFIDMGTQAIEQLNTRRIPIDSVKGIFITHVHGDHINGLVSFVDLCSWYYKTASPIICIPDPFEKVVSTLSDWIDCGGVEMRDFDFRRVDDNFVFDDGIIKITALRTKHIAHSYAYLVEAEGKRVLFSGDLCHKGPENDFPMSVLDKPLDLAICESAHFPATSYLPFLQNQPNLKRLCFNHYSTRHLASVVEVVKQLPFAMRAEDGTEIVL